MSRFGGKYLPPSSGIKSVQWSAWLCYCVVLSVPAVLRAILPPNSGDQPYCFFCFMSLCCPVGRYQRFGGKIVRLFWRKKPLYGAILAVFSSVGPSVRPSKSFGFNTSYRIGMKWWAICVLICIERIYVALQHCWHIRCRTDSSIRCAKCLEWNSSLTSKQ